MKIYLDQNVYDAARERVARIFDEFDEIVVNVSGGKDSTVVYHLAMEEAERRGRLPLKVYFLDQEAEWDMTIDQIRLMMYDPRVTPYWMQVPFKLTNSASYKDGWLMCWREGDQWLREKDPIAIKENLMGCDRFKEMFTAFMNHYFHDRPVAMIGGLRAEESPSRSHAVTAHLTYKEITWGRIGDKKQGHYTFYPIYDWTYKDVWKAIHDHNWPYCKLYDAMYQHGVPLLNMRVSNVHHETALKALTFLQELEPKMWDRITRRLASVNAVKTAFDLYVPPDKLPYMFRDWQEYRDYLLENLVEEADIREKMRARYIALDERYAPFPVYQEGLWKVEVGSILINDYEFTKVDNYCVATSFVRKEGKHVD